MISVVKLSVWVYSMPNSSNYFAGYKVYEFKEIFLWYTYSNLGYHNLQCTCRSYDKAKALDKLLGWIWLILTLLPILDLSPKGWVLKIEKRNAFQLSFKHSKPFLAYLGNFSPKTLFTFLQILDLSPKGWVLKIERIALQSSVRHSKPFWNFLETSDQNSIYMNPFVFCFHVPFLKEKSQNLSGKYREESMILERMSCINSCMVVSNLVISLVP